jgi:hypothetical protein
MSKLTRENRYELMVGVTMPHRDDSPLVRHVAVLHCRSCGSLLLAGDEDIHERLHPAPSCERAHPTMGIACCQPHAWEDQFRPA